MNNSSTGLPENVAATLCYAVFWISGLVFLLVEKRSRFVRFHAMQSVMAFGILAVANVVVQFVPFVGQAVGFVMGVITVAVWIVGMAQAWQGRRWKMPIIGEEAERQAERMVV
ncbi:MAG: hypothetical protein R3D98_00845 [Candidatus Krumholzibacteriia bacterium]